VKLNPLIETAGKDRHDGDCCASNYCRVCGMHVSGYNANWALIEQRPEAAKEDWWIACDNGDCEHAYGEELFQGLPEWVEDRRLPR
jgi:hypothetical protein